MLLTTFDIKNLCAKTIDCMDSDFNEVVEGKNYKLQMNKKNDDEYLSGEIIINQEDMSGEIECNVVRGKKYKIVNLKSEETAYKELQEGEYYLKDLSVNGKFLIHSVELRFLLDTNGFIQPVYVFKGNDSNNFYEMEFIVSAIMEL